MQLHGERQPECTLALEAAGATVIEVPVYRWAPPTDPAPLHRLIDLIAGRLVDAVTFTSAPAAEALLRAAGDRTDAVLAAFRGDVLASCVGAVTAEPLLRRGVPVSAPGRARLGALVRTIVDELPRRTVDVQGRRAPAHAARARRGDRRRAAAAGARADGGAAGAGPRRRGGCCRARRCCGRCPGARTSTRWRWPSPGCGPACARPAWCRPW